MGCCFSENRESLLSNQNTLSTITTPTKINQRKSTNGKDIFFNTQGLSRESEFDISRLKTNCNERTYNGESLIKMSTEPSYGFSQNEIQLVNIPIKQINKLSTNNSNFEEENDLKDKFPKKFFKENKTSLNNPNRFSQHLDALKKYNFLFSDVDKFQKRTFYTKTRSKTVTFKLSDCDLSNQGKIKNPLQSKGDFYEFVEFSQMHDKINQNSNQK